MTNTEFRASLKQMNLRQRWLAERLGVTVQTVSRWATGGHPVPPYVPFVLYLLHEAGRSHSSGKSSKRVPRGTLG